MSYFSFVAFTQKLFFFFYGGVSHGRSSISCCEKAIAFLEITVGHLNQATSHLKDVCSDSNIACLSTVMSA